MRVLRLLATMLGAPAPSVPKRQLAFLTLESRTNPAIHSQLRIVDYNVGGDIRSGWSTILQDIGNQNVAGLARPVDILLLQESDSQATTTQAAVNALNALYGSGTYARGTIDGSTTGAGRPGIVYRTSSVDLIQESALSVSGAERAPMRYQLRPDGLDSTYDFYIYVSHYKASQGFEAQRNQEAQGIRANADALGQGAEILYVGDFNVYTSTEPMYQTLLGAGNGQAFDPINTPGDWHDTLSFKSVHTQSPATTAAYSGQITGGMDDRFDFILHSQEIGALGTTSDGIGLEFRAGSYRAFGNNGTHTLSGAITTGSGASASTLSALASVSDHIPVVADYDVVVPGGGSPTVTFTTSSQSGAESVGTMTVTAQLSATSASIVTVPFTLSGTATGGGTDYSITASPISIPAGQLTGTVTITVANDSLDEANETVVVTMGTPVNATQGATTVHTATINDDDATPTVTFTTASQSAAENVGTLTVTAQLSAVSGQAVTVPFTLSGTATGSGTDYSITSSPITIAAGSTTSNITITVVDDAATESSETVIVTMGSPTNATQGTTTVHTATIVDNEATTLRVNTFTPTATGFAVDFNRAIDATDVNLYDSQAGSLGTSDVVVTGPGGVIRGSLVINPSLTRATFVQTGGVLADGNYSVTLRSATNGFNDSTGEILDGDGNGTAGGDYTTSFPVSSSARSVGSPDFARGYGQPVNVPANGSGLPLRISDGSGVTSVQVDLIYDSALLSIPTGTFPGGPFGSTLTISTISGGVQLSVSGLTGATGSNATIASIGASIPVTAPYSAKQLLDFRNVVVNGGAIASRDDDSVHVAAYLGDSNGSRTLTGGDASLASQLATGLGTGLVAFQTADPIVLLDANGSSTLTGGDASLISQKSVSLNVPAIPDVPTGLNPPTTGIDPRLYFPTTTLNTGRLARASLRMEVTDPAGITLSNGTLVFRYHPAALRVFSVRPGSMLAGFKATTTIDSQRGIVVVRLTSQQSQSFAPWADGELLSIRMTPRRQTSPTTTRLNLLAFDDQNRTELNGGGLVLIPAPTNDDNDLNDGLVSIVPWSPVRSSMGPHPVN